MQKSGALARLALLAVILSAGCGVVGPVERSAFEGFDVEPVEKSVDALEGIAGNPRLFVGTE
jgi:hypothetical protein